MPYGHTLKDRQALLLRLTDSQLSQIEVDRLFADLVLSRPRRDLPWRNGKVQPNERHERIEPPPPRHRLTLLIVASPATRAPIDLIGCQGFWSAYAMFFCLHG
jgi:hypothetical protein